VHGGLRVNFMLCVSIENKTFSRYWLIFSSEITCLHILTAGCNTTSIPGVDTLDIFNNSVKLSVGTTVESNENVSVKCRHGFDPDIDYEDPYVMTCDHGDWSKELTCTHSKKQVVYVLASSKSYHQNAFIYFREFICRTEKKL